MIIYIGFIILFLQNIIITYYLIKIYKFLNKNLNIKNNINDLSLSNNISNNINDNIINDLNNTIEPDISEINKLQSDKIIKTNNIIKKKSKFIINSKKEDLIPL